MNKVITDKHPFMQKVNKLYSVMEELGICIYYGGAGGLVIQDVEKDQSYRFKDKDSSEYKAEFPTGVEFKLTYEI